MNNQLIAPQAKLKIAELIEKVEIETEPYLKGIPYPQADDIRKVRRLVEHSYHGYTLPEQIQSIEEFVGRQVDCYGNAAIYLGFMTRTSQNFIVTLRGKRLVEVAPQDKPAFIIERMLAIPSIRSVYAKLHVEPLTLDTVISSMRAANIKLNQKTTERRRAQTIYSWVTWGVENLIIN